MPTTETLRLLAMNAEINTEDEGTSLCFRCGYFFPTEEFADHKAHCQERKDE